MISRFSGLSTQHSQVDPRSEQRDDGTEYDIYDRFIGHC